MLVSMVANSKTTKQLAESGMGGISITHVFQLHVQAKRSQRFGMVPPRLPNPSHDFIETLAIHSHAIGRLALKCRGRLLRPVQLNSDIVSTALKRSVLGLGTIELLGGVRGLSLCFRKTAAQRTETIFKLLAPFLELTFTRVLSCVGAKLAGSDLALEVGNLLAHAIDVLLDTFHFILQSVSKARGCATLRVWHTSLKLALDWHLWSSVLAFFNATWVGLRRSVSSLSSSLRAPISRSVGPSCACRSASLVLYALTVISSIDSCAF